MTFTYPDARTWAQEHSLANVPRLARLEGFAFQRFPEVVAAFGSDGAAMAERALRPKRSKVARGGTFLLALIVIAGVLAPAAGVGMYSELPPHLAPTVVPLDASIAVPLASVCFMVAALMQVVTWIWWLRTGARWSPILLGLAAYTAVMAVFAAFGLPNRSAAHGYTGFAPWLWPVWLTLVLSVALFIGVLLRRKVRRDDTEEPPATRRLGVQDREHARALVRTVPADALASVQADRDDALRILENRGLLREQELELALKADLGTLFTLDPLRREDDE